MSLLHRILGRKHVSAKDVSHGADKSKLHTTIKAKEKGKSKNG